jgi:hypothetical protein
LAVLLLDTNAFSPYLYYNVKGSVQLVMSTIIMAFASKEMREDNDSSSHAVLADEPEAKSKDAIPEVRITKTFGLIPVRLTPSPIEQKLKLAIGL